MRTPECPRRESSAVAKSAAATRMRVRDQMRPGASYSSNGVVSHSPSESAAFRAKEEPTTQHGDAASGVGW